jgi:hypothetical protein
MPNVPNFKDLERSKRSALDRFSFKNVINQIGSNNPAPQPPTPVVFPADGLLAYWKLDEASSTRHDATGNGYDLLTPGDVPTSVGKILSAAEFNPTGSPTPNFLSNNNLSAGPEFSVSTWVKFLAVDAEGSSAQCAWGTGSPNVITGNDPSNPGDTTYFLEGSAQILYSFGNFIVDEIPVEPDAWYHSVCTVSPTANSMYINGNLIATVLYDNVDQSFIGFGLSEFYGECGTGGCPLSGIVDETGVWNRVLTPEEVTRLYNNGNALAYPYNYPGPSPTPTPSITPTPTVTPTPTHTPTPTPTPPPTGYQNPPWNFTTYIQISGATNFDSGQETWTVSQFNPSIPLLGSRITYRPTYASTSNRRFALVINSFGDQTWRRYNSDGFYCVAKTVNPVLSTMTVTKLPGGADGWTTGEDCQGNTITFYVSGFN